MRPSLSAAALIIGTTGNSTTGSQSSQRKDQERVFEKGNSQVLALCRTPRRAFSFKQLSTMTKLEFKHSAGNYGLTYEENIVVKVKDQAEQLGVRPGWKIAMIDNKVCNNSEDVRSRLLEAMWQWRSCHIWFVTDMKQIRAEQAAKKIAAEKAETERLAELPFADCQDPKHLEQLRAFIQFQGYIEHREHRAITLQQLKEVLKWVKDHCHRWRDADPPELSRTSRMQLNMNFMNTYHLNHWLVKPATLEKDCSFTEMLTNVKQPADWFVIHWWGDRLKDVLRCLELQISTRELGDKTTYWFGSFACRQHSMMDNVGVNPEATCYFRAMRQANFQVLLILDSKTEHCGPATPFTRTWCGYEMSMSLGTGENSLVLDVATCEGGSGSSMNRPSLITRDLTTSEKNQEMLDAGSGYRAKAEREKSFSLEIVALAMRMQVQSGHTLRADDKQRILNSIVQRDLDEPAVAKHESYNRYNQRLRALFALGFWRRVMAGSGEQYKAQQLQLCQALKGDVWRNSLEISMAFMTGPDIDEKVQLLAKNLPPNLKELKLDLKGTDIGNETITALASVIPNGLETFVLDFSHNPKINSHGVEQMVDRLPSSVTELKMDLAGTKTGKEVMEKANNLDELKQHIIDEEEKGCWCTAVSMSPSPTGRMVTDTSKSKLI